MAFSNSFSVLTLAIPMDEPRWTGLTNNGQFSFLISTHKSDLWVSHCDLENHTYGTMGIPSAATTCLVKTLSIATAEANISHPTNGTFAMRSNPMSDPSSPYVPCIEGNTMSIFCVLRISPGQMIVKPSFTEISTVFQLFNSSSYAGFLKNERSFIRLSQYHFPSFVI